MCRTSCRPQVPHLPRPRARTRGETTTTEERDGDTAMKEVIFGVDIVVVVVAVDDVVTVDAVGVAVNEFRLYLLILLLLWQQ